MSLTIQQIRTQVMDYLEATECSIIEKSPHHVTVKLSPRADRMLTDRPYYWGFVERTGVVPETLSFNFVFDPEKYDAMTNPVMKPIANPSNPSPPGTAPATDPQAGILARYFGVAPTAPWVGPGMIRREDIIYGSKRLRQIWTAAQDEGRCVYLFEDPGPRQRTTLFSASYEPWLGVCYKVEMTCDLKCEQLNFIGISLASGVIVDHFEEKLASASLQLTPRLPENVHIQPYGLTPSLGTDRLEAFLTSKLAEMDYSWAEDARERLRLELAIIDVYYEELLKEPEEEKRLAVEEQYSRRHKETVWQYEPKVTVSAVTYGLFHLRST
ncbi:MAG: YqhG family protein [Paenibacillus sp.]|nr:YqhG family protein [Paenibacillus sp.]